MPDVAFFHLWRDPRDAERRLYCEQGHALTTAWEALRELDQQDIGVLEYAETLIFDEAGTWRSEDWTADLAVYRAEARHEAGHRIREMALGAGRV